LYPPESLQIASPNPAYLRGSGATVPLRGPKWPENLLARMCRVNTCFSEKGGIYNGRTRAYRGRFQSSCWLVCPSQATGNYCQVRVSCTDWSPFDPPIPPESILAGYPRIHRRR